MTGFELLKQLLEFAEHSPAEMKKPVEVRRVKGESGATVERDRSVQVGHVVIRGSK